MLRCFCSSRSAFWKNNRSFKFFVSLRNVIMVISSTAKEVSQSRIRFSVASSIKLFSVNDFVAGCRQSCLFAVVKVAGEDVDDHEGTLHELWIRCFVLLAY
jgi:hypothetical protein